MLNLRGNFTMRKDGAPKQGDWCRIVTNKANSSADVYIYDEIGFWGTTATDFVNQLKELDTETLNLHVNSPGGEIFDGLAIYNALKQSKSNVVVHVDGLAASAASFIAQAGDEIIMARNAQMMIHDGIGVGIGNEADLREVADLLSRLSDNIADIYAQRAGGTPQEWRNVMRGEQWYSGLEAVDAGLADKIYESDEDKDPSDTWDLSVFKNAGRSESQAPTAGRERLLTTNRAKDGSMAKLKNSSGPGDGSSTPTPTPTPPPTPVNEADGQGEGQTEELTPAQEENPTTGGSEQPPPSATPEPQNSASVGVLINGSRVTNPAEIQAHITRLETAQNEAQQVHRSDFVENLARQSLIPATNLDATTTWAQGLSDQQFAEWSALYENATPVSLLENHGGSESGGTPPPTNAGGQSENGDRVEVLKGIVAMHERTMSPEKLKNTPSYIELQSLLGESQ